MHDEIEQFEKMETRIAELAQQLSSVTRIVYRLELELEEGDKKTGRKIEDLYGRVGLLRQQVTGEIH